MPKFVPTYPVSLVHQVATFLTNAILDGQIKGGERLVENGLQKDFGVSRAPIREAFRVLEKNGLVTIIPRKGTFVREIARKDIEENFPVRAHLESLAASLAVENVTPDHIKAMDLALSRMKQAARNKDFKSYMKYHSEFHEIFIRASKNDTLIEILEKLRRHAIWFRYSYLRVQESMEYALGVHQKILDLFIKKDVKRLEAVVKEHISIALTMFLRFLESQGEKQVMQGNGSGSLRFHSPVRKRETRVPL